MTSYDPTLPLSEQLLAALRTFDAAHHRHEHAERFYREMRDKLDMLKTAIAADVAADATLKNDTARKAAAQSRLYDPANLTLLSEYQAAEEGRSQTSAELERATEYLKTLRAIARLRTEELHLQAEIVAADRVANADIPF